MTRIRPTGCFLLLLVHALAVNADDPSPNKTVSPAEQFKMLVDEFAKTRRTREFAPKFLELAKENRDDPVSLDSLTWVVANAHYRPEATEAMQLLERDHVSSERMADSFNSVARAASPAAESLLQTAFEMSPHRDVRAQAYFHMAALLESQLELHSQFKKQPNSRKRMEQYYGTELTQHIVDLDAHAIEKRREDIFERIASSFADVATADGPMGSIAGQALYAMRHLKVGKSAPEIDGEDIDGARFNLSDYRGKIVLLSFWGHW